MLITTDNILLIGSVLLFLSILAGKAGVRFGFPVLLLFLLIGMLFGTDGFGIRFDNPGIAQFIGVVSLCVILFSGGMETDMHEVRPVLRQGITLATVGVLLTTFITGSFVYLISKWALPNVDTPYAGCLLLGAVMASTDSASVFNILRSKNIRLKHNIRPMLELESGSNDPMAYMLTIVLIEVLKTGEMTFIEIIIDFIVQFGIGGMVGYLLGRFMVYMLNNLRIESDSLYQIVLLTFVFFTFAFTNLINGNGFLAIYIAGLVVGNRRIIFKRDINNFFSSLAWFFQLLMFLTLGLLVNPHELLGISWVGLSIGIFMMLIARPVAVFLCLLPFRNTTWNSKLYISWMGLRGAVPIIFATYPLLADIPGARQFFNIVFFITLLSLLLQGTTVSSFARRLKLTMRAARMSKEFDVNLPQEVKSIFSEFIVTRELLAEGDRLFHLALPVGTLVVLVKRYGRFFVPHGRTQLLPEDKLLLISDSEEELRKIYLEWGIEEYSITRNE